MGKNKKEVLKEKVRKIKKATQNSEIFINDKVLVLNPKHFQTKE